MPDLTVSEAAAPALGADDSIERVRELLSGARASALGPNDLMVASEIAYAAGDPGCALAAMRLALRRSPDDATLRYRAAFFAQMARDWDEAAHQYRETLRCDPGIEGAYASLATVLLAKGDVPGAVEVMERQRERTGSHLALARQLVSQLVTAQRSEDALAMLERVNGEAEATEETLRMEAELAVQVGRNDQAIRAAYQAWQVRRESVEMTLFLARLLCSTGRYGAALPALTEALEREPDNAEVAQLLLVACTETGEYRTALQAVLALIRAQPDSSALWLQAASLASLVGETAQAIDMTAHAARLNPQDERLLLGLARLLGASQRLPEAVEVLDRASAIAPSNPAIRDLRLAYLQMLDREQPAGAAAASNAVLPLPRLPASQRRRLERAQRGPIRGALESMRVQARVIIGLIVRDLSHRTVHSRFGLASAVIEPLIQVAMLGLVLSIFTHGKPPLGHDIFFFYATGVLPFYLFLHVVSHNLNVFIDNQQLLQIPLIKRLDLVIATALCELLIGAATTVLVFAGFYVFGMGQATDHTLDAVLAYMAVWLLGCGIALNCAVLNNLTKFTERVWQTTQRVLYFISGIFFLAAGMPDWARQWLVWNPLLICVEWFRSGFFPQYEPPWLDRSYVLTVSAALIVLGLMMERALRRRFRTA